MAQLDDDKAALTARLQRARSRISAYGSELGDDLNVPAKVKTSFREHRAWWLVGISLAGLGIAKIPPRTKKVVVDRKGTHKKEIEKAEKAGLAVGILKILFDITKPMLVRLGKALVLQFMERRRRQAHPYYG